MIYKQINFLDQDVLLALRKKFETSRGQAAFEVNHMGRWGKGLEAGSYAPVLILPIPEFRDYFIEKYPVNIRNELIAPAITICKRRVS